MTDGSRPPLTHQENLFLYVHSFVDELARLGVRQVCISPGSRSTPLAWVLARHGEFRLWTLIDERSAGYFALGLAKTRREPVALVCTSGTAAANYLPAVVEANLARVPLLVLTADRPHELRGVGAPQTMDQIGLYGTHVKEFIEMAPPEGTAPLLRYARTAADRAVARAAAAPAGPVHLNFPFRGPLVPLPPGEASGGGPVAEEQLAGAEPPVTEVRLLPLATTIKGVRLPREQDLDRLTGMLTQARSGLIVCGPPEYPGLAAPLTRLAARLGFPILADPLSDLRAGTHDREFIVDSYDVFLRDLKVAGALAPDLVLRFGPQPTSKALLLYLTEHGAARHVVVDEGEGWRDPAGLADFLLYADPVLLSEELAERLAAQGSHPADGAWSQAWLAAAHIARSEAGRRALSFEEPFEGRIFTELAEILPANAILYAGNSMPVRDLDSFFPTVGRPLRFLGNRGASGIDGVISSALGAAAAEAGPLVLVIGDLSFYHDQNGLLAAKLHELDATVVLVHNDGGGIFSFLPQAGYPEHYETLFGTPTGLDFEPVVRMYGGRFRRAGDWPEFRRLMEASLRSPGLDVLELRTERRSNAEMHSAVWSAVSARLEQEWSAPGELPKGGR